MGRNCRHLRCGVVGEHRQAEARFRLRPKASRRGHRAAQQLIAADRLPRRGLRRLALVSRLLLG